MFVNNVHRFISHGVQDFPTRDHFIVFVVKKAGVCKGHGIIKEVRSFKQYNKEQFCKDVAKFPGVWLNVLIILMMLYRHGLPFSLML